MSLQNRRSECRNRCIIRKRDPRIPPYHECGKRETLQDGKDFITGLHLASLLRPKDSTVLNSSALNQQQQCD
jgi:hypothetical protein